MKTFQYSFALTMIGFGGFLAGSSLQVGDEGGALLGGFLSMAGIMLMGQFSPRPANFIESPVTTSDRILSVIGMAFVGAVAAYAAFR